ncbi:hypothetical protein [Streptomyces lydicus]|uniref:hypothetical protein n=1 Tax=Streptomyces lydicus TaxID=47763 RepID=UPI00379DA0F1
MAPSSDQRTTYGGDRTTVIPPEGGTATTTVIDARGVRRALGSDAVQCNVNEGFTLRFGVPSLRGCGGLLPGDARRGASFLARLDELRIEACRPLPLTL